MFSKSIVNFALAIFLIVLLVYTPNIRNEFVRYDDFVYIIENEAVSHGLTGDTAVWSFRLSKYASNWHPLTWMSHALDISITDWLGLDWRERENNLGLYAKLSGPLATISHGMNVLLQALNATLLFLLIVMFLRNFDLKDFLLPAALALFWAIHPLRVEVVAWASERKELLSVFFMLLTLLAYFSNRFFLSLALFGLALLSKPVAVSLPAILFAYDWLISRRSFRASVLRCLPFVAMSIALCALTFMSQTEAIEQGRVWSVATRLACVVQAPAVYLAQTFWPFGLSPDYAIVDAISWPFLLFGGLLHLAAMSIPVWHLIRPSRWSRILSFGLAWVYIGLLPMIGLVKVGYEPHSDRYTYWIGCGCALCACVILFWLKPLWVKREQLIYRACACILLVLSFLTIHQSSYWRNTKTLFGRIVSQSADENFAHLLGINLSAEGEKGQAQAEDMLRDVLGIKHSPNAQAALALHLATFGRLDPDSALGATESTSFAEARLLLKFAIEDGCRADWAYAALAMADYREKKYKSAYEYLLKAKDNGYDGKYLHLDFDEWKEKAESVDRDK